MNTIVSRLRRTIALTGAIVAALSVSAVSIAQTPFFPFTDFFDNPFDDNPVTWFGGDVIDYEDNAVTTQVDPIGGAVVLSNPAQLNPMPPNPYSLGVAYALKDGQSVMDGNVRARAVLQVSDPETFGSIALRVQDYPPLGDSGAYFANINGAGVMQMGDFLDPTSFIQLATSLDPVANPVMLEFSGCRQRAHRVGLGRCWTAPLVAANAHAGRRPRPTPRRNGARRRPILDRSYRRPSDFLQLRSRGSAGAVNVTPSRNGAHSDWRNLEVEA